MMERKLSIEFFLEPMEHDNLSDSITLHKKGYRLDEKGRGGNTQQGIRCAVNCETFKSVDYLYDTNQQAYLVEFSDLWTQYLSILERIKRLENSSLEKKDKSDLVKAERGKIRSELREKFRDTLLVLNHAHKALGGWTECLQSGKYKYRIIIAENKGGSPDQSRFMSRLLNELRTSVVSDLCVDVKLAYIDKWAEEKNYA